MDKWRTTDIHMAAAFRASGSDIIDLETDEGARHTRITFVFERTEELKEKIVQYTNNELTVDAKSAYDNLKHLKNLGHNAGL